MIGTFFCLDFFIVAISPSLIKLFSSGMVDVFDYLEIYNGDAFNVFLPKTVTSSCSIIASGQFCRMPIIVMRRVRPSVRHF